jgi:hypothetical protein
MSVCCECCVLSGRGLCDGLITRPEESYQVGCLNEYDREATKKDEVTLHPGIYYRRKNEKKIFSVVKYYYYYYYYYFQNHNT